MILYDLEKTSLIHLVDVIEAHMPIYRMPIFGHICMTAYEMRSDIWHDMRSQWASV